VYCILCLKLENNSTGLRLNHIYMLFSVEGFKKLKIVMRIAHSSSSMQYLPIEVQFYNWSISIMMLVARTI
jgi:hypothetical protein